MNVTPEKLQEIFKVYDENRENRIPTAQLRTYFLDLKPNLYVLRDCFPVNKILMPSRNKQTPIKKDASL